MFPNKELLPRIWGNGVIAPRTRLLSLRPALAALLFVKAPED